MASSSWVQGFEGQRILLMNKFCHFCLSSNTSPAAWQQDKQWDNQTNLYVRKDLAQIIKEAKWKHMQEQQSTINKREIAKQMSKSVFQEKWGKYKISL